MARRKEGGAGGVKAGGGVRKPGEKAPPSRNVIAVACDTFDDVCGEPVRDEMAPGHSKQASAIARIATTTCGTAFPMKSYGFPMKS